jgi:hypothetical protein
MESEGRMKAAVLPAPEQLKIADVEISKIETGEILYRPRTLGIRGSNGLLVLRQEQVKRYDPL